MRLLHPLAVVLIFSLLASGCSLFKRDLKSSNESADAGGAAIPQKDAAAPSEGVAALEKAPEDSFDWNKKSAPAKDLPLPPRDPSEVNGGQTATGSGGNDIWSSSGNGTPSKTSQQTASAMGNPIEGPAIEPAPTGKPLNQEMGTKPSPGVSQPITSTQPITQTSPLSTTPGPGSSGEAGALTLRSSSSPPPEIVGPSLSDVPSVAESTASPGFKTIHEDASQTASSIQSSGANALDNLTKETDRQASNLAHAISPSGTNASSNPETSISSSPPETGFKPLKSDPDTPSSTTEPAGNLLAMGPGNKTGSDVSPGGSAESSSASSEPLPDANTLKEQGIQQYRDKKFDEATKSFKQYLSAYPDENQEIEWRLAQSLFLGNRWGEAEKEFDKLRGSPRPEFRADAILKLGMIDQKRGNVEGAREKWKRVVQDYPKTEAATRATKLLAESP